MEDNMGERKNKRFLKRFTHKFVVDDKGAVSIYLIVITLLLFIFNAVLIDFARIIAAERQTEEAAKTALRSTMSSYNKALQDKGLFGFEGGQSAADDIFKKVFTENLTVSQDGDTFNLVGLSPVDGEVSTILELDRSLANKTVLEYQILEEMKYKAPVEVGEALIESFLTISSVVEQASEYSDIASDVNGKAKKREEMLEKAKEYLIEANAILAGIDSKINGQGNSTYPDVNDIADIRNKKSIAFEEIDDDDDSDEAEEKREDAKTFKEKAIKVIEELIDEAILANAQLHLAYAEIQEAELLNIEITALIDDVSEKNNNYNDAKEVSEQAGGNEIEELMDTLDDYKIKEEFFTALYLEVDSAIDLMDSDTIQTNALIPKLEKDFLESIKEDSSATFTKRVEAVQSFHKNIIKHHNEAIRLLKEERAKFNENKGEIDEEEEAADTSLEENKELLDEIKDAVSAGQGISSDNETYTKLKEKATEYGNAMMRDALEFEMEDRDETADEAMSFIDLLFNGIGELLLSARDKAYINEYILLRFKSHDHSDGVSNANEFKNNQVEYIIYGINSYGANYLAALSEIFAVRFAIHFTAALLKPKTKIFGPLVWAAALASAFAETAKDMKTLTKGRSVVMFPIKLGGKTFPRIDYKGHLRLFLFAHPEGARMERLMAVLDHTTESNLAEKPTYITGKATSSIKLWFLPTVVDMLGRSKIIEGRVEGNHFLIEKEVHFSY